MGKSSTLVRLYKMYNSKVLQDQKHKSNSMIIQFLICGFLTEFMNPTESVKDRIIKYMVQKGIEAGKINENTTLVEGNSGNTGASVAMIASSMGLKSILFVPDKCSEEKIAIIKSYGAEVIIKPAAYTNPDDEYGKAAAIKASESEDFYHIDQFNSMLNPEAHYMTLGQVIWNEMNGQVKKLIQN